MKGQERVQPVPGADVALSIAFIVSDSPRPPCAGQKLKSGGHLAEGRRGVWPKAGRFSAAERGELRRPQEPFLEEAEPSYGEG
jgi:hypothetical protein